MAMLKISEEARARARYLAERDKLSMGQIVEKALALYEEQTFFQQLARDFEAQKHDPAAFADYIDERDRWSAGWQGTAPLRHGEK